MQKKLENFSQEEISRLVNSPSGKQLLALLQQSQDPGLKKAMEQASTGNLSQAKVAMEQFISNEQVQKLLRQLGG